MRTYKTEPKKVVDEILCDVCGESCTITEPIVEHEYAELIATWGYFSDQDGKQFNIDLCENCFNDVLSFMRNSRKKILGPNKYPYKADTLEGSCYFPS
jgi:hypothetical protein